MTHICRADEDVSSVGREPSEAMSSVQSTPQKISVSTVMNDWGTLPCELMQIVPSTLRDRITF